VLRSFIIILLLAPRCIIGQSTAENDAIRNHLETWMESTGDEAVDYTPWLDELHYFSEHPIDLNRATDESLSKLHLLSELEIDALLNHLERYGKLNNLYELQAIKGWTPEIIQRIFPFVMAGNGREIERMSGDKFVHDGQHDLFLRYSRILNAQDGYQVDEQENGSLPKFRGSPNHNYLRYKYSYKSNLRLGITAEKDAGEALFPSHTKGFDFQSGHLQYAGKGLVKKIIIGDFLTQFGQGLTLWNGPSFGKSVRTMHIKFIQNGLKPYTSVDENRFMRGMGIILTKRRFQLTLFASGKSVDANLVDSISSFPAFSSFQQSGFHRTTQELKDKDAVRERIAGGNITFKQHRMTMGFTCFKSIYLGTYLPTATIYNEFTLKDNKMGALGFNYAYRDKGRHWFGEISRDDNGAWATVHGLMAAIHPSVSLSALYRKFGESFQNSLSGAFSENSKPVNEEGLYLGCEIKLSRVMHLSAYCDQFRFPWLKFGNHAPSSGIEYLAQWSFKPSKSKELYLRYRHRNKSKNTEEQVHISYLEGVSDQHLRLHTRYSVSETIHFKTRLEWSIYQQGLGQKEHGFLFYHDMIFKKKNGSTAISLRYAVFDTDSYAARIYAYENDLLYTWNIPSYSAKGSRFYIMLKQGVGRTLDFWLRYSIWVYNNKDHIGNGPTKIDGRVKSEMKIQLRWQFR